MVCRLSLSIVGKMIDQFGFVKHGQFGCVQCDTTKVYEDRKGIRCDCELSPKIDPRDVLYR